MIDLEKLKGEYTMLSYLVFYAERARDVMRRAMVSDAMFTLDENRTAFAALMQETTEDSTLLFRAAGKSAPAIDEASYDAFYGLSSNPGALEHEAVNFVREHIAREAAAEMRLAEQMGDGRHLEVVAERLQSIAAEMQARVDALNAQFPNSPPSADPADANATFLLNESLLHVPGFIDEYVDFCMRAAPRPNRVLAFAGALALLAHLAGRKFIGPNDARPNIYLIALAGSGVGKDFPRTLNRNIAQSERMEISVKDGIGSGQGIEDALVRTPALLLQIDEFDTLLNTLKDARGNTQTNEATWFALLSMFSNSNSNASTRVKSGTQNGGGIPIYSPSLSALGTAIPDKFYGALCERALTNGFLARSLVFEAGKRSGQNMKSGLGSNPLPSSLAQMVRSLSNIGRRFCDNSPINRSDLIAVDYADGAETAAALVGEKADKLFDKAEKAGNETEKSVWNRSLELVLKLSLLYAISEGIADRNERHSFAISQCAVEWAWKIVKPLQQRMIAMALEHTAAGPTDEKTKKVLRAIRKAGKKGISRSDLSTATGLSSKELDDIEKTLLDRDSIAIDTIPPGRNGKQTKIYLPIKRK